MVNSSCPLVDLTPHQRFIWLCQAVNAGAGSKITSHVNQYLSSAKLVDHASIT